MNPSEDPPLWDEIERLRRELTDLSDRHHAEFSRISVRITELEAKLKPKAAQPPPLPKKAIIPPRKAPPQPTLAPAPASEPAPEPPPKPEPEVVKPAAISHETPEPLLEATPEHSFELDFAKVWFVRIGIVIFLTGLVFAGNYAYQNWIRDMPNGVRLCALFACALALGETGRRLAKKENLSRFGEVLLAGGMAFFYYCTFASHHVGRLKVIESPVAAAVLLFAAAGAIAAVSWLRKTQATAILGIVLASYSTMLQPIGWMSSFSSILLGGLGLFFMLRPGWSAPGWASMLGSYGAFFGWQLLGVSGPMRINDPAVLWFLPPVWVMFAIPGVLGRFRESLDERMRAWFTAINNGLFFLLFSGIWLARHGDAEYWKVAAVFGPILMGLGILGRRQSTTAGGVNMGQGLAIATLALILKLEGQHLALALGLESLALAVAARKYRGKCETVFSLLCGVGAALMILAENDLIRYVTGAAAIPIWSAAITAALVAAASLASVRIARAEEPFGRFIRLSASMLFLAAALIATHLCLFRLEHPWGLLTAALLSGALSFTSLKLDAKRLMPVIPWVSLGFLGIALTLALGTSSTWALACAAVIAIAATWLWHRQKEGDGSLHDLAANPGVLAYAFSLAVPVFLWCIAAGTEGLSTLGLNQAAAFLLVPASLLLRTPRLTLGAALYSLVSLTYLLPPAAENASITFASSGLAIASAVLLTWRKGGAEGSLVGACSIFRLSAFISYCAAWQEFSQGGWMDFLAITSIVLMAASVLLKRKMLVECLGLIAIALAGLTYETLTAPWEQTVNAETWRGVSVVIALLSLVVTYRQRPALMEDGERRDRAITFMAVLTCLVITTWATQMLVWRFGWKPSAVLWTVLGFAFVSAGLWQRLHVVRVCGFLLLILSFGKLFTVDVWDFTTFLRVVSFIVLGAALILLGLFYNKFAGAIKALLDDERGGKR